MPNFAHNKFPNLQQIFRTISTVSHYYLEFILFEGHPELEESIFLN